ncbi:uncharacterized protein LOC124436651 [Xenia sp. Carnegie-2017]|uniref:uncharacterized protein LOC124436651 n=1 Tax=Xenia sp. Carnegie-2017 TaxID=2897299 RepID=UPI001F0404E5|nr:uncharacterized protein LOC124436651 [Xenia sp. Carnegie-2017]
MLNGSSMLRTTYSSEFSHSTTTNGRPTRFYDFVSFQEKSIDKLLPRCFPHFALHISPHRILDYERSALGFPPTGAEYSDSEQRKDPTGVEDAKFEEEEEGHGDHPDTQEDQETDEGTLSIPQIKKRNSFAKDLVLPEKIEGSKNLNKRKMSKSSQNFVDEVTKNIYKSTAHRAAEEYALTIPKRPAVLPKIIGNNEDRELYHSIYPRIGNWKTEVVPKAWERGQERPLYEAPRRKQSFATRLRSSKGKTMLIDKREQPANETTLKKDTEQVHTRPFPGYGGFVPKLPVIPSPQQDLPLMQSTYSATYGNGYKELLRIQEYAHKGPLSKVVSPTFPYNPFNKAKEKFHPTSALFAIQLEGI